MLTKTYRKRPIEVEGIQIQLSNRGLISKWAGGHIEVGDDNETLMVPTKEGTIEARIGDWVVRNDDDGFAVVRDAQFRRGYEVVNGESD